MPERINSTTNPQEENKKKPSESSEAKPLGAGYGEPDLTEEWEKVMSRPAGQEVQEALAQPETEAREKSEPVTEKPVPEEPIPTAEKTPEELELGAREERDKSKKEKEEIEKMAKASEGVERLTEEAELARREAVKERKIEDELNARREDYVNGLLAKEKAAQSVEKLSGWRRFFMSEEKLKGRTAAEEELQKLTRDLEGKQGSIKEALKNYRESLLDKKRQELAGKSQQEIDKEMEKYAKEVAILTSAKEATTIYNLKHEKEIEEKARLGEKQTWEWIKAKSLGVAQWYRQQSLRNKLLVSGALFGGAISGAAIGGTAGAAIVGGVAAGRWIQRSLSGLGTAVGLEALMKRSQEKAAEKKITKEFTDGFLKTLQEKNDALDDKLFKILGGKKSEERRRYLLAGAAGIAVGSGAAAQAFNNLIPVEWKTAIAEKFGFRAAVEKPKVPGVPPEAKPGAPPIVEKPPEVISALETVRKGDSVWKILERQAEAKGLFRGLGTSPDDLAKKTYIIDALKDRVAANPEKFGLTDIDKLKISQRLDLTEIFKSPDELDRVLKAAGKLSKEQLANILKNNEILREWVKAHPGLALTSEKVQQILTGKIPQEVFPFQAEMRPEDFIEAGGRPQISAMPEEIGKIEELGSQAKALAEVPRPEGESLPASFEELERMGFKDEEIFDMAERAKLTGKNFVLGTEYEKYQGGLREAGYFDKVTEQGVKVRPTLEALGERMDKMIAGTMDMDLATYNKVKLMNLEKFIKTDAATLGEHFEWKPAKRVIDEYLARNKFIEPDDARGTLGDFFKKIIKIDIGK